MAKSKEKRKAIILRKQGESIKVIAKMLGVSASSVSDWCEDVKLSRLQLEALEKRARDPNYGKRLENSLLQRQKRIEKERFLRKQGIEEIGNLNKRELFLVGVALYWAEGFKKDSQAGFATMDPRMIRFFLRWVKECFNYRTQDLSLRVTVNISHKYRIDAIQKYWSKITMFPIKNFQKPFYQNVKWKKIYDNPDEYFGVLRVKVHKSTDFLRKIHGWIEGLSQLG